METNLLKIVDHSDIEINSIGNKQIHIRLEDIRNHKELEYVIFETAHYALWETIMYNNTGTVHFPGKIIDITVNLDLIKKTKMGSGFHRYFKEGFDFRMVLWECDKNKSYEEMLILSLNDQLFRLKKEINRAEIEAERKNEQQRRIDRQFYKDYDPFSGN
jgi:hypothetical protein